MWSHSHHTYLQHNRIAWGWVEPQGVVKKAKRHRDIQESLQYILTWLPLSRAVTNWIFTKIHAQRAATIGHRLLHKITRKQMKGLLSTWIQMVFPCATCTSCMVFVISTSTAWWSLHLLPSPCHQQLSLKSLTTAISAGETTASCFSLPSILSLWYIYRCSMRWVPQASMAGNSYLFPDSRCL